MKKIIVLFMLFTTISTVFASHDGFNNTNIKKVSVAEALKMNDDTSVIVQGSIVKKLFDDRYLFKDTTGSINVEIDNDKWKDISADTKDILILVGEIEKKFGSTFLDVDSIQKVAKK